LTYERYIQQFFRYITNQTVWSVFLSKKEV